MTVQKSIYAIHNRDSLNFRVSDIAKVVGASIQGDPGASRDLGIHELVFDARKLWGMDPSKALFLALKGRRDGHDFLTQAYGAGVRTFLVTV